MNFLIDNAVDNEKTIQTLANDKEFNWNISKSDVNDGATSVANAGLPNGSLTTWDPQGAYVDANQNTHSPIDGLLHEGGHAYIAYGNYQILKKGSGKQSKGDTEGRKKAEKEYYDRLDYFGKPEGNGWMNYEEKYVIQNYENPFMKQIMKEEPRPSHKGKFYKSENPYSRKPVSGTVPIYKPKK